MINFWTQKESEIESGYFWNIPSSNPLVKLGVIDKQSTAPTWLVKTINKQLEEKTTKENDKSIVDRFSETFKKRWDAWAWILTRWVKWDTGAIEWWLLMWANFLWTLADLTWDVIAETYTEIAPEDFQKSVNDWLASLMQTSWWEVAMRTLQEAQKKLEDVKEKDPVKWARLQWWLDLINWALTLMWWKVGTEWVKVATTTWKNLVKDTAQIVTKWADDLLTKIKPAWKTDDVLAKLDLQTTKWKIWDVEVDIPVRKTSVTEKVTAPFREVDTKVLAGRSVSPRTVWKNAKQKLNSITDVEKNTKSFYENVRTWKLEWNIDTLEDAAQTIVNNIDTVWERIWNAVKKVDWVIEIDNKITDDIINALWTKGADVSPATSILKKFYDELWDWKLSIPDAYELKKAYSNEVTKLYKAWDAWTKQYKALSDWVKFLNTKIDDLVETNLWDAFAADKWLYWNLKTLVDDMVASSLVEWRKAPNSLAEQIWMVESIFSPVSSIKSKLIQSVWEANSRWWAWKELIKQYDETAIKNLTDFIKN